MNIHYLSETEYLVKDVLVDHIHERPFCIFDLEGTGIFVEKGTSLNLAPLFIRTEKYYESLTNVPAFAEAYQQFIDFCGTAVLVTQAGYEYDLPMLHKHCRMSNISLFENRVIDTKALFAKLHPELFDVFSTDYLVRHYQIKTNDIKRHDALGDCVLISRILDQILMEYKERNIYEFNIKEGLTVKRFAIPAMYLKEE